MRMNVGTEVMSKTLHKSCCSLTALVNGPDLPREPTPSSYASSTCEAF